MSQLVHLHVHTQYSILDGASPVKKLVKRAAELGMEAVAITDHGNMFGVKEFHDAATREGIKPILGCEAYIVRNRFEKDKNEKAGDHLLLLAKDLEGYHNLARMISYSWIEGFYGKPRIDKQLLRQFGKGVICSSACLGGEVPQAIMNGDMAAAERAIGEYKSIFGDDFYLEMQLHRSGDNRIDSNVYANQLAVNKSLRELATKTDTKLIVTNDVHFVLADDAPAHDRLICLNTGSDLDDPNRMRYTGQEYLKSYEQMAELFPDDAEAIANTLEIAAKVDSYSLDHEPLMPDFPIPDDLKIDRERLREIFCNQLKDDTLAAQAAKVDSPEEFAGDNEALIEKLTIAKQHYYLEHLTFRGADQRWPDEELTDDIRERLRYELDTVAWMGFPGYFLIVWDFIREARAMGVAVGPGRGSAAGSAVAYCLGITNIDPIKYKLLFERFLNPDRISLPDVDVDFDEDGRAAVINYVIQKYGSKRVAQIITFGTMAPKLAIRDVARVQKLSLPESDRLAKLVPEQPGTTFEKAYKEIPELRHERESENALIRDTLKYAEKLEGSIRQTGVHACGVIIGKDDLENYVPLATSKDAELNVVQYDGKQVESIGLIKMDFLGLKTLSIIKDAVENISEVHGKDIDVDKISLHDEATYELYSRGDTTGLFQFESPGMKKHLRNLKPSRFEDLIAMNALYRPGPMDYIEDFVARKHGRAKVIYEIAEMEEYLSDTYGITVYQEQVMLLSQKLAGFTGGQADTLRKAMGKKQKSVLDKLRPKFLEGAEKRGHDPEICEKVWKDWEAFASYAFNKSHSTCYAYISYQTAYLKAHYPNEFMAALLSRSISDIKKISFFMDECKRMGLNVLGPDVNASGKRFMSDKAGVIRFGLQGIKGVGENAVQHIIEERKANGGFVSIYDFVERVNLQTVNKKNMENLALAGAFDNISGFHRCKFFAPDPKDNSTTFLEQLIRYGSRIQADRNNTQQSLFGDSVASASVQKPELVDAWMWSKLDTLNKEREMVGIYLSAHPLDDYDVFINNFCKADVGELNDLTGMNGKEFAVAGMITDVQHLTTKTGKPYGRFTLEGYRGSYQFTLFSKDYEKFRPLMFSDYTVMVKGRVTPKMYNDKEFEPRISTITQLSEAQNIIKEVTMTIPVTTLNKPMLEELTTVVRSSSGNILLRVRVMDPESGVSLSLFSKKFRVDVNRELVNMLEDNNIRFTIN